MGPVALLADFGVYQKTQAKLPFDSSIKPGVSEAGFSGCAMSQ
jgi:hypothetical protein